jgi:hypothetical protein
MDSDSGFPFTPISAFPCATLGGAVGGVLLLSPPDSNSQGIQSLQI